VWAFDQDVVETCLRHVADDVAGRKAASLAYPRPQQEGCEKCGLARVYWSAVEEEMEVIEE